jgi:glycosyltransferase involved in cell wall biosynthesis
MIKEQVSVIIPTKDRPHYLPQAVESVLSQTYPQIELIIIDDGSADSGMATKKAIEPYLSLPHLTYLYQENRGIGATVNRGLALARGEYIQRLDDDDRLLPDKIAKSVEVFEANPAVGLVATGYYLIDAGGRRYLTKEPRPCPNSARLLNMLMGCISTQAAVMVRAEVHQKVI